MLSRCGGPHPTSESSAERLARHRSSTVVATTALAAARSLAAEPGAVGAAADEPVDVEPTGVDPAGDEPTGNDPADDDPTGDDPADDDPEDDDAAGDDSVGDEPVGVEPVDVDEGWPDVVTADPADGSGALSACGPMCRAVSSGAGTRVRRTDSSVPTVPDGRTARRGRREAVVMGRSSHPAGGRLI